MENSMEVPWKTKNGTTVWSSSLTPGHVFGENQKDSCTPVFIATLFIIPKTWKQPDCTSREEWIKKMWYIYMMEYYSTMEKNKIMPIAVTWMDLEVVILSEVGHTETNTIWCHLYVGSKIGHEWAYLWNRLTDIKIAKEKGLGGGWIGSLR